jgi:hypothetical protein
LNLSNQIEREIAITILVLNKEAGKKVASGLAADRSKLGNKSCFRNEKHNGMNIVIDSEYHLPESGVLEFDFVYLIDKP